MVIVEPIVNEEKLRQLLDERHESAHLDYKVTLNLDATADEVELAKDVGAMQCQGGYIVVGTDDSGNPTGNFTPILARHLDESTLRPKMLKYLPAPLDIRTAVHTISGSTIGLIYVGRNSQGFAIFSTTGQYPKPGKKQPVCLFRAGDVFVRHGTSSERWNQSDIDVILRSIVAGLKEEWRRELADDFMAMQSGGAALNLSYGPAAALTFQLDEETFRAVLIEQLRRGDDIPLKLLLGRARQESRERYLAAGPTDEQLQTIVSRLACLATTLLDIDDQTNFERVVRAIFAIYELGFIPGRGDGPQLWLSVVEYVLLLGGAAVRAENWQAVRRLATAHGDSDAWSYNTNWLRHGQVHAARSGLMGPRTGDASGSLVAEARALAAEHPCLHADAGADQDLLLDSICQFDALAGLAAMDEIREANDRAFYTNFARFWNHRTEPALVRLIADPSMRAALFRGTDGDLARCLAFMNRVALNEGFRYSGWEGLSDQRLLSFIGDNLESP